MFLFINKSSLKNIINYRTTQCIGQYCIFSIVIFNGSFRGQQFDSLLTCRNISISITINSFIFINWCLSTCFAFWPVPPFAETLSESIVTIVNIAENQSAESAKIGFSMKVSIWKVKHFYID